MTARVPASLESLRPLAFPGVSACVDMQTPRIAGRYQRAVDTGSTPTGVSVCSIIGSSSDAGGVDNLEGMTAPTLLDIRAVAAALTLTERTVRNYHQLAERRRREGTSRPGDFPPPDQRFGRTPVWKASTIRQWKTHRPGQGVGGGRPRKEVNDG